MFTRLAEFRRAGLRYVAQVPNYVMNSNDNLPGFRRPAAAGKRRSPTPALACHWFNRNGRLECRWQVADEAPAGGFDERRHSARGRPTGGPRLRSRNLALAGPAVSAEDFT